ncbi:cyclic nucleotide-binding domain-containing protein [Roseovarius faecimaris]|uniref:Cyclic nucleotide-binding domain-containing protein n=2 Tax=Roseovarius faecimaris TaxID=2494550 RepID=A0A6I6IMN7_9RHOB|nr:cyclic nucleotide-binding domain-containing protein [Roseovarius faecimaris]
MLSPSHLDCMKQTTFFGMLPSDVLDKILPNAQVSSFQQGEAVYRQGDTSRSVYCVAKGAIKLTVARQNGTEVVVDIFHPGTSFAEALLFRDDTYPVSAVALADSEVISVPKSLLEKQLREKPDTLPSLLTATYMHLHRLVRQIENLKAASGHQRVADFLLALADHNQNASTFQIPYEKQTLASMLGIQPETLSRAFKRLSMHGVEVHGPEVTLTDRAALEAFVNED